MTTPPRFVDTTALPPFPARPSRAPRRPAGLIGLRTILALTGAGVLVGPMVGPLLVDLSPLNPPRRSARSSMRPLAGPQDAAAFVGLELVAPTAPGGADQQVGALQRLGVVAELLDGLVPIARVAPRASLRRHT